MNAPLVVRTTALLIGLAIGQARSAGEDPADQSASVSENLAPVTAQAEALKTEQYAIATELLDKYPSDFEAWRVMGFVHSSHGNLEEMSKCWQKCLELQPDRPDTYDQLGRYYERAAQYEEAINYWQQALEINPGFAGVHQRIGSALLSLGRADEARAYLKVAIELAPEDAQSHYLLGEAEYQAEDFTRAKRSYLAAIKIQPNHAKAHYGLVKTCGRLGAADEMQKYASRFQQLESAAVKADQEFRRQYDDLKLMRQRLANTCVEAGRIYIREKLPLRAEALWQRAGELDNGLATPRQLLATLYRKQGKALAALALYEELTRMEPANPDHHKQLGFLQAGLGKLNEAERAFRKTILIAPQDADGYRALAKFYLNTKRQPKQSLSLARKAVELEPVADSFFVLGWSLAVNGRRSQATAALNKATELNPRNPTYRQLRDMVEKK